MELQLTKEGGGRGRGGEVGERAGKGGEKFMELLQERWRQREYCIMELTGKREGIRERGEVRKKGERHSSSFLSFPFLLLSHSRISGCDYEPAPPWNIAHEH